MNLFNGCIFEIKVLKVSDCNCYVWQVKLNGKVYDKMYIIYVDFLVGGIFEFDMVVFLNKKRGFVKEVKFYFMFEEQVVFKYFVGVVC